MYNKAQNSEEDVNSKIYKLYQNIKKKEDDIKKSRDKELVMTFDKLVEYVYEIFLNNNVKYLIILEYRRVRHFNLEIEFTYKHTFEQRKLKP